MIPKYYAHELYHHSVKGMKWGQRRWQNEDGSLKPSGKKRYSVGLVDTQPRKLPGPVKGGPTEVKNDYGERVLNALTKGANAAGQKRYSDMTTDVREKKAAYKQAKKDYNKSFNKAYNKSIAAYSPSKKHREANDKRWYDAFDKADQLDKAKTEYKNAKRNEQLAIRNKTRELSKNASIGEKLTYNTATRKKTAQYIVQNNMTVEEASKKAKGEALRNTAAFLAVYGGVAAAVVYKANH